MRTNRLEKSEASASDPAGPVMPRPQVTAAPENRSLSVAPAHQRTVCLLCQHAVDPNDESAFVTLPCHVRAFWGETFKVWRCPGCCTIHCLEIVDLDRYYAAYPFTKATLTWPFRIFYRNLSRRLTRFGLTTDHSLLDYGCGNGLFVEYLRRRGFKNCHGYDPYGARDGYGNPASLECGPFDYILLQDVLEHVEDPNELLAEMDGHLRPGGHILVGTPNTDSIDLRRPEEFWNEVHVPYHLHIFTREAVETMGRSRGWTPVGFFDRPYSDRPWFGLNTRAAKTYQRLVGGTMDAVLEPLKLWTALSSPKFVFYALVGYWLSFHSDMAVMFRKDRPSTGRDERAGPRVSGTSQRAKAK